MIHFLFEGNKDLQNRVFPLPKGIRKHLQNTLQNYNGDKTVEGYKRLNNVLSMKNGIAYNEMKRIKHFFDNYQGTRKSADYILNGGEPMQLWVTNTLNTATKAIEDFKQAKKDAGIKNAFIKPHEKDRQTHKKLKPTQVKFKTDKLDKKIKDNNVMQFENILKDKINKRTICITEQQLKNINSKYFLKESIDNEFSLETLSSLTSFKKRYEYCVQHIGKPQGRGSSRVVFQMSDDKILKLAYNKKGVAQNLTECDYMLDRIDLIPHIYDRDPNGLWVVAEYVLPATEEDFKNVLGLTFQEFVKFIHTDWIAHKGNNKMKQYLDVYSDEELGEMIDDNEDLQSIDDYIGNYDVGYGDLTRIQNYGMTIRNDYPTIVLLDAGLSTEVWNNYYAKR